ncbi:MAG: DUF2274 domain-containing protein [Acetobacter orientalis]|uniref:DUF2274 domain-containing protein n=1 Tax=Acetobacter orientalis TaxID=146474 RepID=UPI0039EBC783
MNTLRITEISNEKPVRVTVEMPASVYRNLSSYAQAVNTIQGHEITPQQLICPMIEKFILSDRVFLRWLRKNRASP